jgi:toxin ParE1/3/4
MQIRWSPAASEDLFHIIEFIRTENAPAARRVAKAIYDHVGSLSSYPYLGRQGRVAGTRVMSVPSLPFIVVYRVLPDAIEIAGVIHGAQRWPPQE